MRCRIHLIPELLLFFEWLWPHLLRPWEMLRFLRFPWIQERSGARVLRSSPGRPSQQVELLGLHPAQEQGVLESPGVKLVLWRFCPRQVHQELEVFLLSDYSSSFILQMQLNRNPSLICLSRQDLLKSCWCFTKFQCRSKSTADTLRPLRTVLSGGLTLLFTQVWCIWRIKYIEKCMIMHIHTHRCIQGLHAQSRTNRISAVACWKLSFYRKSVTAQQFHALSFLFCVWREIINLVISLLLYKKL